MISDKDARLAVAKKAKPKGKEEEEMAKVLTGFNLRNNKQDRRMLFEVTGMRIVRDEFLEECSSDSE